MSKFFVKQNQINKDEIKILNEDVNHIKNVLRLAVNDEIIICDEDNSIYYMCNILEIEKDFIICKIKEILPNKAESNVDITIYQGLPKADKMERIIDKEIFSFYQRKYKNRIFNWTRRWNCKRRS